MLFCLGFLVEVELAVDLKLPENVFNASARMETRRICLVLEGERSSSFTSITPFTIVSWSVLIEVVEPNAVTEDRLTS